MDSSGVFSISPLVKISMISLISSLPLKLYLKSLVFNRSIFRSSSKVFGNLRRDIFENVWERSSCLRNNFGKSLGSGHKSSENRQKHRHKYVYIIKRTLYVSSKI